MAGTSAGAVLTQIQLLNPNTEKSARGAVSLLKSPSTSCRRLTSWPDSRVRKCQYPQDLPCGTQRARVAGLRQPGPIVRQYIDFRQCVWMPPGSVGAGNRCRRDGELLQHGFPVGSYCRLWERERTSGLPFTAICKGKVLEAPVHSGDQPRRRCVQLAGSSNCS
jgi:hypothetical protein